MKAAIIAFDGFTDIDVFLPWDLLNRVKVKDFEVQILGSKTYHTSMSGLTIPVHGGYELAAEADAVLFASGPTTRNLCRDESFLQAFQLDPARQLIGSMCSGALLLAGMGFLTGKSATTYPTAVKELEKFQVHVVEKSFVSEGNIATAAGCLAAQELVGWMLERLFNEKVSSSVLQQIQPVGAGL